MNIRNLLRRGKQMKRILVLLSIPAIMFSLIIALSSDAYAFSGEGGSVLKAEDA